VDTVPSPSKWSKRCFWLAALFFVATVLYNAGHIVYSNLGGWFAANSGPVHDFGILFAGETREHVFRLENVWSSPVTIAGISSPCGCTTVATELKGKTVDVGEVIEVPVRWTTAYSEGDFTKKVAINFVDSARGPLWLTMRGQVKPRFICSPNKISIEADSKNDLRSQTLTIKQVSGAPPFELVKVTTNTEFLSATFDAAEKSVAGNVVAWRVTVTTVPPLREGRVEGNVFLQASDPTLKLVPLSAVVSVQPGEVTTLKSPIASREGELCADGSSCLGRSRRLWSTTEGHSTAVPDRQPAEATTLRKKG
jgi:hypothetical protein